MTLIQHSSHFDCTPEALFAFHLDAKNLGRLSMPGQRFRLLSEEKTTEVGDLQILELGSGPVTMEWLAEILRCEPPHVLEDIQVRGPFRKWRHQHRVTEEAGGARLTDTVSFRFLPTIAGEFVEYWTVRPLMKAMFLWRHRKTRELLKADATGAGAG